MSITANTKIEILNTPKAIWDYANDPENWTASNPKEHMGLTFFNESNRPIEKTRFHQRETVAGVFADLKGYISYVNYPHVLVWNGIAQYKLFRGLIRVSVAEGGLLRLEERGESTHFSHDVYMQFTDTLWGKIWYWLFAKVFHAEKAVYDHTYRELVFFKKKLDLSKKNEQLAREFI